MTTITKYDDTIDSRDIIARIEELETAQTDWNDDEDNTIQWNVEFADDDDELDTLRAIDEECNYGDWEYGTTLIRYSYFTEYVQEMLEDCGDISKDLPDYIVIDWEATASNINYDYTSVDFGDITYYLRNQ